MEKYWHPRLARAVTGAFEIDALFPEVDGVTLDYRGYDGVPVRTHFRFTSTGKISLTACMPIRAAARGGWAAASGGLPSRRGPLNVRCNGRQVRRRAWFVHLQFRSAALSKRAAEILGSVVALANPNRIAA